MTVACLIRHPIDPIRREALRTCAGAALSKELP